MIILRYKESSSILSSRRTLVTINPTFTIDKYTLSDNLPGRHVRFFCRWNDTSFSLILSSKGDQTFYRCHILFVSLVPSQVLCIVLLRLFVTHPVLVLTWVSTGVSTIPFRWHLVTTRLVLLSCRTTCGPTKLCTLYPPKSVRQTRPKTLTHNVRKLVEWVVLIVSFKKEENFYFPVLNPWMFFSFGQSILSVISIPCITGL